MSVSNKINGVYRDTMESASKVNGVWRNNTEGWGKVNGVWRLTHQESIDLDNIIGFKLIYTLNKSRIHHDNPRLKYNPKIPYEFKLTGDTAGEMDYIQKGVVFEYMRELSEEEGTIMYEGRLYFVNKDGKLFNVCQATGNNKGKEKEDEIVSEFSNIYDVGKLDGFDIKLYGYLLFEDYGYYFAGWNNLFNTKPFIDPTIYPDKTLYRKRVDLNPYILLPVKERDEFFDTCATIGIARDMETPIYNMTGSYGVLDHSIVRITLNGKDMPFVIEIV